jgi:hypothetical protein
VGLRGPIKAPLIFFFGLAHNLRVSFLDAPLLAPLFHIEDGPEGQLQQPTSLFLSIASTLRLPCVACLLGPLVSFSSFAPQVLSTPLEASASGDSLPL